MTIAENSSNLQLEAMRYEMCRWFLGNFRAAAEERNLEMSNSGSFVLRAHCTDNVEQPSKLANAVLPKKWSLPIILLRLPLLLSRTSLRPNLLSGPVVWFGCWSRSGTPLSLTTQELWSTQLPGDSLPIPFRPLSILPFN